MNAPSKWLLGLAAASAMLIPTVSDAQVRLRAGAGVYRGGYYSRPHYGVGWGSTYYNNYRYGSNWYRPGVGARTGYYYAPYSTYYAPYRSNTYLGANVATPLLSAPVTIGGTIN